MATVVAPFDIVRVSVLCRVGTRDAYNIWYFVASGTTGVGTITYDDLATTWKTLAEAVYPGVMSPSGTLIGASVNRAFPAPPTPSINAGDSDLPGLITGDVMSRQTCGAVTKRTELAGKAYRGRAYIPFPSEASNDADGNPTNGYRTAVATLCGSFCAAQTITVGTATIILYPIIYHKATSTYTVVSSFNVRTYWTTQRRRNRKIT